MATYKIVSDKVSLGVEGSTLNEKELEGMNIQALIDGGHLEVISARSIKQETKESDK